MRKALSFILAICILCCVFVRSAAASVPIVNTLPAERAAPSDKPMLETASAGKTEARSENSDGQSAPTGTQTQNPPAHHNHHVRNLVILVVALTVGFVVMAAAAK